MVGRRLRKAGLMYKVKYRSSRAGTWQWPLSPPGTEASVSPATAESELTSGKGPRGWTLPSAQFLLKVISSCLSILIFVCVHACVRARVRLKFILFCASSVWDHFSPLFILILVFIVSEVYNSLCLFLPLSFYLRPFFSAYSLFLLFLLCLKFI